MTILRRRLLWVAFAVCGVALLATMGWVALEARRLERAEAEGWLEADRGERVRLALWRMDSALAPLITQEVARPYFTYSAFYPARRAYNRMFAQLEEGDVLVSSPLLGYRSRFVRLHFQVGPDGAVTSPQVPEGNMLDVTLTRLVDGEFVETARALLESLVPRLDRTRLLTALPAGSLDVSTPDGAAVDTAATNGVDDHFEDAFQNTRQSVQSRAYQEVWNDSRRSNWVAPSQKRISANELQQRMLICEPNGLPTALPLSVEVEEQPVGMVRAVWLGEELVLARRVRVNESEYVQGCWFDWKELESWLRESISDLLPEASLEADVATDEDGAERRLAALPVRLVPGRIPAEVEAPRSPLTLYRGSLYIAMFVAAGALVSLVFGAITLSERRRGFVSAVTHEMRTPLTTFRLYTEMLEDGIITDEAKRRGYLRKLRREADRLGHLVENVLAFARLESGRTRREVVAVTPEELLERCEERLRERAEQDGLELRVDRDSFSESRAVTVDLSAVEQILLNLIDNACKYAGEGEPQRIDLSVDSDERHARIRVRDHGPGISDSGARRLFRPFSKSVDEAARSAPGVGLGLALSRRFAREMGGDLVLDTEAGSGACFVLALPFAPRSRRA